MNTLRTEGVGEGDFPGLNLSPHPSVTVSGEAQSSEARQLSQAHTAYMCAQGIPRPGKKCEVGG